MGETLGFLPCNFFVRLESFRAVGGYSSEYFFPSLGIYFREDSDFAFRLLGRGERIQYANDVIVSHPEQFREVRDYFRHTRRYFFDPLLFKNHPELFRRYVEVKRLGPITIHRPFHLLAGFFILNILAILLLLATGATKYSIVILAVLVILHAGVRYRYERRIFPRMWKLRETAAFLILPFHYFYWFLRGCLHFRSWGALV